jgi:hypothetical protein
VPCAILCHINILLVIIFRENATWNSFKRAN